MAQPTEEGKFSLLDAAPSLLGEDTVLFATHLWDSWHLLFDMARGVMADTESDRNRVLYIAPGMREEKAHTRIAAFGLEASYQFSVYAGHRWSFGKGGGENALREVLAGGGVRLVILDGAKGLMPPRGRPYAAHEYQSLMQGLQTIARQYGVTIVSAPHMDAKECRQAGKGEGGFAAGADLSVVVVGDENRASLRIRGDAVPPHTVALVRDGECWQAAPEGATARNVDAPTRARDETLKDKVLHFMEAHPREWRPKDLRAVVNMSSQQMSNTLDGLLEEGAIRNVKYGVYRIVSESESESLDPSQMEEGVECESECESESPLPGLGGRSRLRVLSESESESRRHGMEAGSRSIFEKNLAMQLAQIKRPEQSESESRPPLSEGEAEQEDRWIELDLEDGPPLSSSREEEEASSPEPQAKEMIADDEEEYEMVWAEWASDYVRRKKATTPKRQAKESVASSEERYGD